MFPIRVSTRIRAVLLSAVMIASAFAGTTHTVQPGETLSDHAKRHGTTVAELVRLNGIRNPNHIVVGSTLTFPSTGSGGGGTSSTTYRIQRGDTLAGIAARFGTTVSALVATNGVSNKNLIIAGRTLTVPGSSTGSTGSTGTPPSTGGPGLPGQRHTVRSGESLGSIASRHGISSRDLATWNGITDGRIYASTSLMLYNPGTLPGSGTTTAAAGSHTVRSGETLANIASRFKTTIATIAGANSITNPNRIRVGQRLTIPGGGGGSASVRCPIPGATFFNDWGFPRSGGRTHAGNDLFARRGTPVYAPVSGRVQQATGTISGRAVRVVDATGSYWYVAHLDAFGASGTVSAGTVIGYVGDSGNARGSRPHGHVEFRNSSGVALNPYPILRAVC